MDGFVSLLFLFLSYKMLVFLSKNKLANVCESPCAACILHFMSSSPGVFGPNSVPNEWKGRVILPLVMMARSTSDVRTDRGPGPVQMSSVIQFITSTTRLVQRKPVLKPFTKPIWYYKKSNMVFQCPLKIFSLKPFLS